jgi:hypothetical protein
MPRPVIRPHRYRQFGSGEGCEFVLATNERLRDQFDIQAEGYAGSRCVVFDSFESFETLLKDVIPEPAHILVISPHCFFRSPHPDQIGPRRKLMAMACNSTPTPLDAIAHFLEAMERTDPARQGAFADRFFELGEVNDRLEIVDERNGTRAVFDHLDDTYVWNQQAGPIEWGEQQVAPSGVITVLPAAMFHYDASLRLAVNGEIALHGRPIVHSGVATGFVEEQSRIYARLARLHDHAAIATVEDGLITHLRATHADALPAVSILEAMFEADPRYRVIWEIGFAINTDFKLFDDNSAMNEIHGARDGVLRWGIGLIPHTRYAPIFLCPYSRVSNCDGDTLIGPPPETSERKRPGMRRRKVAGCPCHWFASNCATGQENGVGS